MARMVHCAKLKQDLPGLERAPLKGPLGARIYNEISAEAWKMWLGHSTMVINEYRLNPAEPGAQKIMREQLERFLFGDGAVAPPDYVPPKK